MMWGAAGSSSANYGPLASQLSDTAKMYCANLPGVVCTSPAKMLRSLVDTYMLWLLLGLQSTSCSAEPRILILKESLNEAGSYVNPGCTAIKNRHHTQPEKARNFNAAKEVEYENELGHRL